MFDKKSERDADPLEKSPPIVVNDKEPNESMEDVTEKDDKKKKPKKDKPVIGFSDLGDEPEDIKELNDIHVVGDLAEYVGEYLIAHNAGPEQDTIIATVDGDKPLDSKKYLQIGTESFSFVFLGGNSYSVENRAFLMYLEGRGIKATTSLSELVGWVKESKNVK